MYVCDNMMHLFCTYCIEISPSTAHSLQCLSRIPLSKNGQLAFKMQNTAQANTEIETSLESISTGSTKDQHRIPPAESFESFEKKAKDSQNDRSQALFAESKKLPKGRAHRGPSLLSSYRVAALRASHSKIFHSAIRTIIRLIETP